MLSIILYAINVLAIGFAVYQYVSLNKLRKKATELKFEIIKTEIDILNAKVNTQVCPECKKSCSEFELSRFGQCIKCSSLQND